MSNIYSPYRFDVEDQHRYSIRHKYSAIAHPRYGDPFELDVEDCNVTFDSSWSPFIQANLSVKLIEDAGQLAALDPRNGCRVSIYMGYTYDGFIDDVNLVADLHVRSRTVDRPDNQIKFRLESDEALAQDFKALSWHGQPPLTGINEFVAYHAEIAQRPTAPVIISDFPAAYGASSLAGMVQAPGQDSLRMLSDAADRLGIWIYVDGSRRWNIRNRPQYAGDTALKLSTGATSTILDVSSVLTRGDVEGSGFHNAVCLKYMWKDSGGVDRIIYGNAAIDSGPYDFTEIGYNTFYDDRPYPVTDATIANYAASMALRSLAGRGHQMSITAHAAYWLRPGMTVTVQLPLGDQERLLVRQVTFNPTTGTMQLALFQPIDITITNTGA